MEDSVLLCRFPDGPFVCFPLSGHCRLSPLCSDIFVAGFFWPLWGWLRTFFKGTPFCLQEGGWAEDRWFFVGNRRDCLWSPRPQGVSFVAKLFSLVAGVAVARCRHWCEVPGVPGWHVERREGVGAMFVVLPVWGRPLIVPFRVPVPGTPAVVVLPGPWIVVVVVDVPPVIVLPVGGPVVSLESRSSAPVGVAVFRVVGARVILLPGSAGLVLDVCPRVPLLACSVAAVPGFPCWRAVWRPSPGSPAGVQCGGRPLV